ncbi:MAG: hypothetical protein E7773_11400 [Sphingomonas sp.]|uniref:hypothetical protein n=1 Tax=Sphingomonas sp. TaxID=28214 RepID=UPI00120015BA|nr:hypothetical protein [Sphingomonas sp.]THD35063.1 MAG: hypothetical protein E7773_11400 [Sphingomonas sp.]
MLRKDTTFVIGAGGSHDFGFPLGEGLRNKITDLLAVDDANTSINVKDPVIAAILKDRAIREAGVNDWTVRLEAYRRAAATIRAGLPYARSIDGYLEGVRDLPDVEFLAKLAIATIILRHEAGSSLVPYTQPAANAADIRAKQVAQLTGSWHAQLGQILFDGHTRDTVDGVFERASFVIFNYDRCIEEFLVTALQRRFAIDRGRAVKALARCNIIHPYGQVGAFFPDQPGYVPFGKLDDQQVLPEVAAGIRTFTEAMEESIADAVKDCIAAAETIVFMGFGWLAQNMELLGVGNRVTNATKVFATTMGMPKGEVDVVSGQMDEILRRRSHSPPYESTPLPSADFTSENGDCKALMTNCWLRLTSD